MTQEFWLDLFTGTTWQEFLEAGGEISGFRENRWTTVQKIKTGDYLLCYLTGLSRWIGVLEVVGEPYQDESEIWKGETYPCRLPVKIVVALTPEIAVPVKDMRNELSVFKNLKSPSKWQGAFRGSPARWKQEDGQAVIRALQEAERSPVVRPVDPTKLARKPATYESRRLRRQVTVPEPEPVQPGPGPPTEKEVNVHTEIQWVLLKLGSDLGLDVWVARNDRSKEYQGRPLGEISRMLDTVPVQFERATQKTIELIDVLWLRGNSIEAAFEIESTTSIYSGLLRMSDLVSMQPNINIPLYLVAPDERRQKVLNEVNRPTFSRLDPPLPQICRFIPFSALRERVEKVESVVKYLKPDFIKDIAESCELEED